MGDVAAPVKVEQVGPRMMERIKGLTTRQEEKKKKRRSPTKEEGERGEELISR